MNARITRNIILIMRRYLNALPLVGYAIASIALFSNNIANGSIFQPGTDPIAYIWFLKWWPYSISHGLNPFLTLDIWSPVGFSMLWANSIPTLAILMWPVTALASPELSWSILCLAAPALNAYTAYLLFRYLVKDWRASAIGGLLFGFSPYVSSHMLGHLSLSLVALVPLVALVCIRRARGEIRRGAFVGALSVLVVLQFGISMEVLATAAFFGLLVFLAFPITSRSTLDMKGLAVDSAISATICAVVLAPAFYALWLGTDQLPDIINSPTFFSNDLLGFVIPGPAIWIGGQQFVNFTSKFSSSASEQNAYLGFPLIGLAIASFAVVRREPWTKAVAAVTAIAAVMSLGPVLWFAGHQEHFAMPGAIAGAVPLLKHALPGRFAMYTSLGIATLVAAWLARSRSTGAYVFAMVAIIFILPNPSVFKWVSYKTPSVFAAPASVNRLSKRGSVVVLPYGRWGNSILWQLRSDLNFKMAGGYIGFTPKYFSRWPAVDYFSGTNLPASEADFKRDLLSFCVINGVGSIVMEKKTPVELASRLRALNWQSRTDGDSEVIDVPLERAAPFRNITGDAWPLTGSGFTWLGKTSLVINNEPTSMRIALSRSATPGDVAPISISVVSAHWSEQKTVGATGAIITIPPWSHADIVAKSTWKPIDFKIGTDQRDLSVMAEIQ
jgi:hypothetical protein